MPKKDYKALSLEKRKKVHQSYITEIKNIGELDNFVDEKLEKEKIVEELETKPIINAVVNEIDDKLENAETNKVETEETVDEKLEKEESKQDKEEEKSKSKNKNR